MSQASFSTLVTVRNGKLALLEKREFDRGIAQFMDGQELVLSIEEVDRKRTSQQNKFWHAVVIPAFADHCGYRVDEMKETLSLTLIPKTVRALDGTERLVPGHTSELNVKAFNELIELAQQLGAEMDIYIPDPDPQWRETRGLPSKGQAA